MLQSLMDNTQLRDRDVPLPFSFTRTSKWVPLLLCGGFFVATILLTLVGPIAWDFDRPFLLFGFLAACVATLTAGYYLGVRGTPREDRGTPIQVPASAIVVGGALVYLALYLPIVHTSTGKWYPDVWTGITNSGNAYDNKICLSETASQMWTYASIAVAPLTITLLPLTMFFYSRLSSLARVLGITCIALELALGIAQATNKNVAELCAYIVLILLLMATGARGEGARRRILACLVGAAVAVVLFGAYYTTSLTNRVAEDMSDPTSDSCAATTDGTKDFSRKDVEDAVTSSALVGMGDVREGSVFYDVVPPRLQSVGVGLTSYLTQGYQGLSLAMGEGFRPTGGLGFSEFYRHNILKATGQAGREGAVVNRTYSGQIENDYDWQAGLRWSTFFVHPASDITFPGVVLLLGLIGFLFGLSWSDTCRRRDPLACVVFFHLCILVFYLNANNQLFQGGRLAFGFTVLLASWLILRRKKVRQPEPAEEPVAGR